MRLINNFTREEFRCHCGKCDMGYPDMQWSLLELLEEARKIAGQAFVITSAIRCPEWNEKVGGVDSSAHVTGWAVDIAANTGSKRYMIIDAVKLAGFNRIGIASNFVHIDNDPSKPSHVIWTY